MLSKNFLHISTDLELCLIQYDGGLNCLTKQLLLQKTHQWSLQSYSVRDKQKKAQMLIAMYEASSVLQRDGVSISPIAQFSSKWVHECPAVQIPYVGA